ncbi:MAG: alpha-N-acetylglucosaminidase TIM-barrel domain-containing protein, partial [Verrucomicrobiae bacterium]|nr:alpha-N-acetylglucosaminidase TIM-barrel domain-containing protein [Verrucomicrobiae bacterium]
REQTFDDPSTPADVRELKMAFAKSVAKIIREADPEGVWVTWAWTFQIWPSEDQAAFVRALPQDHVCILDAWTDRYPVYNKMDFFGGKPWGVSICQMLGGDDEMRGNMPWLIDRLNEIAANPKARHCDTLYYLPEHVHYNTVYCDLAARLAWDSSAVGLEKFLDDYVLRRHEAGPSGGIRKAFGLLAKTVYSNNPGSKPLYQQRLNPEPQSVYLLDMHKAVELQAILKSALDAALSESRACEGNWMYLRDMVDISRQYMAERFNYHFNKSVLAGGDPKELELCRTILEAITETLRNCPDYRIDARYLNLNEKQQRTVRDEMYTLASREWLLDYQAKDIYEVNRDYYQKRFDVFCEMSAKKKRPYGEYQKAYKAVEAAWLANSKIVTPGPAPDFSAAMTAIRSALRKVESLPAPLWKRPVLNDEVLEGAKVGWEDRCDSTSGWITKSSSQDGSMGIEDGVLTLKANKASVCFFKELNVDAAQFPIFIVKYCAPSGFAIPCFVWLDWIDERGKSHHSRLLQEDLYNRPEWHEVKIHVGNLLANAYGVRPQKVVRLTIQNVALLELNSQTSGMTKWKDLRFVSEGASAAPQK